MVRRLFFFFQLPPPLQPCQCRYLTSTRGRNAGFLGSTWRGSVQKRLDASERIAATDAGPRPSRAKKTFPLRSKASRCCLDTACVQFKLTLSNSSNSVDARDDTRVGAPRNGAGTTSPARDANARDARRAAGFARREAVCRACMVWLWVWEGFELKSVVKSEADLTFCLFLNSKPIFLETSREVGAF